MHSSTHNELSMIFFFFSSRRRHTRCYRDWSSDVCSSDLRAGSDSGPTQVTYATRAPTGGWSEQPIPGAFGGALGIASGAHATTEIGRASCRERGEDEEVGGIVVKKG